MSSSSLFESIPEEDRVDVKEIRVRVRFVRVRSRTCEDDILVDANRLLSICRLLPTQLYIGPIMLHSIYYFGGCVRLRRRLSEGEDKMTLGSIRGA